MLKSVKIGTRVLAALAVFTLVQFAGLESIASSPGRDFSECTMQCNAIRATCGDLCKDQCEVMFARGTPAFTACVAECKAICDTESDECKAVCLAIKNGDVTPEDP